MKGEYARGMETRLKILRYAALNVEVHQYRLAEKVGISYRTVIRTLHELRKLEWLNLVRTEPSEKQGKDRNVWSSTLRGLLNLLYIDKEFWKQLDLIARAHRDKLLIFKKWSVFEKEGVKVLVKEALESTFEAISRQQLSLMGLFHTKIQWTEEELRSLIDSMTLGCYALRSYSLRTLKNRENLKIYLKILDVCKRDHELYSFVVSELSSFKENAEKHVVMLVEGLNFLQN